ncbi:cyclase family protein [uncultured Microbacterium sp.]|uniref:cyclase family protein n=1 Tax=uncultured Microbacterium sp. TaxID=191216 RepID=UPI0035CA26C9
MVEAARLVRSGRSVSCALDLNEDYALDNPSPVEHSLTFGFEAPDAASADLRIAGDRFGMEIHGDAHSHVDALCHVSYRGRTYNGREEADAIGPAGALAQSVTVAQNGITTRGVLLDIPRFREVEWVEPGEAIMPDEFLAAEAASGVTLGRGDILLFRTGHTRRRQVLGPWDASRSKAGIHASVLPILHDRDIAGVGYDGDGEAVPSHCEGIAYPIHAISLPALGWWTFDSLNLDDLAAACAEERRWEFFFTAAPLRLVGGTGSPINPTAIF